MRPTGYKRLPSELAKNAEIKALEEEVFLQTISESNLANARIY
jgi:hypothetical protein